MSGPARSRRRRQARDGGPSAASVEAVDIARLAIDAGLDPLHDGSAPIAHRYARELEVALAGRLVWPCEHSPDGPVLTYWVPSSPRFDCAACVGRRLATGQACVICRATDDLRPVVLAADMVVILAPTCATCIDHEATR